MSAIRRLRIASRRMPQSPADIINARGFWDALPAPKQATPAQVASIRQNASQALACCQRSAEHVEHRRQLPGARLCAARRKLDRRTHAGRRHRQRPDAAQCASRVARAQSDGRKPITTVVAKGFAASRRRHRDAMAAAAQRDNDVWMRVMILAPSASTAMTASFMGEPDMTVSARISSNRKLRSP